MKNVYCVMGCLLNLDYAMTFGDKRPKHASYLYWAISHDEKQSKYLLYYGLCEIWSNIEIQIVALEKGYPKQLCNRPKKNLFDIS